MILRITIISILFFYSLNITAQVDYIKPFKDLNLSGSTSIYDYKNKKWTFTDSIDLKLETPPASTFKIINLLIALETGVIKDENEIIKWVGSTDTILYGYRPDIYKDMTIREAFELSAGWVFIELSKRIGKKQYQYYLDLCNYGNRTLPEKGDDFWNFGPLTISPKNQIEFLTEVYENRAPFSKRNIAILKNVMITEQRNDYIIRSKTGWGRALGKDIGWWIGYIERKNNLYFFATRLTKGLHVSNANFSRGRKIITKDILKQLQMID